MTRRIAILIEYDGTNFVGWQLQPNGRSVQGELEGALHRLFGEEARVNGSGRTDSGVHAVGQVAHFDIQHTIDLYGLVQALNGEIGEDVSVRSAVEVPLDFDSRRDAIRRWYTYRILHGGTRPAIERYYTAWVPQTLNIEAMREAAQQFIGTHDLSAFRAAQCSAESPIRTIERVDLESVGRTITLTVVAPSFLMNQVRRMAGTLIDVGRGKLSALDVREMLDQAGKVPSGPTAPPRGLTLLRVEYNKDPFPEEEVSSQKKNLEENPHE